MRRLAVALLLLCVPVAARAAAPPAAVDPEKDYDVQKLRGWTLKVNKRLLTPRHDQLRKDVLELLDDHLYRVSRVIPAEALAKLREVVVWIELAHPKTPCACFHPSARWLKDNGMLA